MKKNILNKFFILFTVIALFACKSKKPLVDGNTSIANLPKTENTILLKSVLANQLNFTTFTTKAATQLDFKDKNFEVTLNIRIKKSEIIWVSITAVAGIEVAFKGEGLQEKAFVTAIAENVKAAIGQEVLAIDQKYFRPTEVDLLLGDANKARKKLGWQPKYTVQALCKEMVLADLELFGRENVLREAGYEIKNEFE